MELEQLLTLIQTVSDSKLNMRQKHFASRWEKKVV